MQKNEMVLPQITENSEKLYCQEDICRTFVIWTNKDGYCCRQHIGCNGGPRSLFAANEVSAEVQSENRRKRQKAYSKVQRI